MKIALWIVFGVLALLWTGGAAAVAQLVQWSAQGLASGNAGPLGNVVAGAALPSWLVAWIDPAAWAAVQQAVADALAAASASLPAVGAALGWLVPAVWLAWGLGFAVLIVITLVLHALITRLGRVSTSTPATA